MNISLIINKPIKGEKMKTLMITLVSLLISTSAFAGEFSKPLSVHFQSASTYVPATKVCRAGDFLKHRSKEFITVTVCHSENGNGNCEVVRKRLHQPVVSMAQRCAQHIAGDQECTVWESYRYDQSRVRVMGYNSQRDMEEDDNGRMIGWYKIPACAK